MKYKNPTRVPYGTQGKQKTVVTATCTCGKKWLVDLSAIKRGQKSCGCLNGTHRMKKTTEYTIWQGMKDRCLNKKNKKFADYGGRGITVCKKWLKFENFFSDMGYRPKGMSLDRINNNKGYSPKNCRWSTPSTQSNNRRDSIIYKGETAKQAAKRLGIAHSTLRSRYQKKWPIEDVFNKPKQGKKIKKANNN